MPDNVIGNLLRSVILLNEVITRGEALGKDKALPRLKMLREYIAEAMKRIQELDDQLIKCQQKLMKL